MQSRRFVVVKGLPNQGPLSDIRVIELGVLLAGPFCGQLLGDFGADVIKVEQPGSGDPMRQVGPAKFEGEALWWNICARNKKSITLNLRVPAGQEIVRKLVREADVLLENFRPGTLERWGLGYEDLKKINPGLVMVRVSGFGQNGPYSSRPGYAAIGEAYAGMRYVVGDPEKLPSRTGTSIGDTLAGTYAAMGALMAIHNREKTGQGQVVDASIYESVLATMESLIPDFQLAGYIRERTGSFLPGVAPSNIYPTKDDKMLIIAGNGDAIFERLAQAMGQPGLAKDPRFTDHQSRGANQIELDAIVGQWSVGLELEELVEVLEQHAIPYGTLYRAPEMLDDPHFAARESIVRLPMKDGKEIAMQNTFPKLSETPGKVRHVGPALGEHNEEVYGELLGLSAADLERLTIDGVI